MLITLSSSVSLLNGRRITFVAYGHLIACSHERPADLIDVPITPISIVVFTPMAPDLHQAEVSAQPDLGRIHLE